MKFTYPGRCVFLRNTVTLVCEFESSLKDETHDISNCTSSNGLKFGAHLAPFRIVSGGWIELHGLETWSLLTYLCGLKDFRELHVCLNFHSDLYSHEGRVSVPRDADQARWIEWIERRTLPIVWDIEIELRFDILRFLGHIGFVENISLDSSRIWTWKYHRTWIGATANWFGTKVVLWRNVDTVHVLMLWAWLRPLILLLKCFLFSLCWIRSRNMHKRKSAGTFIERWIFSKYPERQLSSLGSDRSHCHTYAEKFTRFTPDKAGMLT